MSDTGEAHNQEEQDKGRGTDEDADEADSDSYRSSSHHGDDASSRSGSFYADSDARADSNGDSGGDSDSDSDSDSERAREMRRRLAVRREARMNQAGSSAAMNTLTKDSGATSHQLPNASRNGTAIPPNDATKPTKPVVAGELESTPVAPAKKEKVPTTSAVTELGTDSASFPAENAQPVTKSIAAVEPLLEFSPASTATKIPRKRRTKHGASKISSGTKSYMSSYPEQSTDGHLRLGNIVPDFSAQTTQGPMKSFHQWKKGKWVLLFSHPSDFTPVCTTEIATLATKTAELRQRDCLLLGLSVDDVSTHQAWMEDIVDHYLVDESLPPPHGPLDLNFPMIADSDRKVARLYSMLDVSNPTANLTIRAVFVIDPEHRLRLRLDYPASVGRNVNEIVRCVKALQLSYQKSIATPEKWPENHAQIKLADGTITNDWQGSVFLLPSVTTEQAFLNYPSFHTCPVPSQKKYLRLVQAGHVGVDPHTVHTCSTLPTANGGAAEVKAAGTKSASLANVAKNRENEGTKPQPWTWPWDGAKKDENDTTTDGDSRTVQEPWKWPWEGDKKDENDTDTDARTVQEPWKWPWEQEIKEDNSNRGNNSVGNETRKEHSVPPAPHHHDFWKWPWEQREVEETTKVENEPWKWKWPSED